MKKFKLEVGKTYVDDVGGIVRIAFRSSSFPDQFLSICGGKWYNEDGSSRCDLHRLVEECGGKLKLEVGKSYFTDKGDIVVITGIHNRFYIDDEGHEHHKDGQGRCHGFDSNLVAESAKPKKKKLFSAKEAHSNTCCARAKRVKQMDEYPTDDNLKIYQEIVEEVKICSDLGANSLFFDKFVPNGVVDMLISAEFSLVLSTKQDDSILLLTVSW